MWRRPLLLLVTAAFAAAVALAQVPPPDAQPAPPPQPSSPVVTIPLTPPPETVPAPTPPATDPAAKVETPPVPPVDAAPVATVPPPPKAKPAKVKIKPKPAPVEPIDEELEDQQVSSGKPPSFRCFVRDVMAFYDRTHVRCYNKARGKIMFFAVDTGQPIAATVLSKALNAIQMGRPVTIAFAPASDLNPSNCDAKNCRRLLDIKN